MAVLTDGQKFGLSSKSQTKKSVICVKLTDSALRSLEEYLKNKVSEIGEQFQLKHDSKQAPYLNQAPSQRQENLLSADAIVKMFKSW